ncbi:SCO family protein [Leptospira sp. 2 VSF19]|uniref:SCO family protein n=1 Tax=Leptospira soteropolitanensis TaxID=2950025 RepID=A0AAW5VJZ7_9LEPT|nr:SCO family protein [Leptospira soteropolitanensis]MCW7493897.1 SCO family protein [Leptospira soteropolitanensis]MCW7501491.1 SCO family protein [Leptospira soteropolitanensis]MCW7523746.1 SCO family protein [Leptospira soteropolitanensis]MCW7527610.1 SCO family protein [Leptospira soteropolitanensis]MCW7531464.1 SCO family protein [Leptospira soteropolitanensis]
MKRKFVLMLLVGFGFFGCSSGLEFTELPIGGNIEAKDKSGQLVSFKSFQEPVLLVFFGYTYCPDFCPNTLAKIKAAVEPLTEEEKSKFKVVFISVDPVRDSPETTTKYVQFYLPQSVGLSFSADTTNQILKQYAAYVQKTEDGQSFDHSTYIYVLDQNRKTRKLIKSTDSKEVITKSILALSSNSVESK